ncbi:aminopeptidase, putative [Talaromyces stipitatus ATCC 10500]|uniref:Aminopeptidase n=1 Tax=Talaromyces stipitatus (strain ATCC 10500 / CBS 375.48 / QM 6759 / NRRL 1006) TaxID=441959 RepID=B8MIM0_TALSN|nr:aminopeptidase, putative [Talaromyces stipitatus ATCC 10500]EED15112.1 aminopeptidase, putative [Talaromyces stipitatus ATCC 10500]
MARSDRDTLPDVVKPKRYDISLYNLQLGGSWGYNGTVKIDVKASKPTKEIVLNTKEVSVEKAEVQAGSTSVKAVGISYDKVSERVTLAFDQEIPSGEALLKIDFTATINEAMAGFSRCKYKAPVTPSAATPESDGYHYMMSTQFEACDARRAFPCFDEPNLKAEFDFEIEVPKDLVALSNMPVKSERDSKEGWKVVSFERTPIMSTYLLAWAVGDFGYVEAKTERKYNGASIPVRVYTTRGLEDQARYALECAHKTVDYFSELFGIEYPLPKSDLLCVHAFAAGAMENWGLVTYRTTAVLFDEGKSDSRYKNRIAYVVAHELAHQWFGNLVTMDWWSELWLNEGFATWVGWLAVDHFHPDWNVWSQFVAEGVQQASQLDSLRASHPIEVPVKNALEVDQIFDHISYLKGSSVIRMLSSHLGQDVFINGVSNYLKTHAYGNATTNDLWLALSKASNLDVNALMNPWIRKIGYPVVTVAEEPGQISLRQNRFLSSGDVKPEEDETVWWIPLGIKSGAQPTQVKLDALTSKSDTFRGINEEFYKINKDHSGFYRTNYPPQRLAKLGQSLHLLSTEDKIGLVGDAAALAVSGESTTPALLALIEGFAQEANYLVWSQTSSSLASLRTTFSSNESAAAAIKKFKLKLVTPAVEKIGWEFRSDEDYLTGQLRKLLIAMAGEAGHEGIVAEAKRRFQLWASGQDPNAIHSNLRSTIFSINVAEGDRAEFERIKEEFVQTDSVDGKEICLSALGRAKNPELIQEYLNFIFSDKVSIQDVHTGAASLANNPIGRYALWEYMKSNWTAVSTRLSANNIVYDRFVRLGLSKFSEVAIADDIAKFFEDKDTGAFERTLVILSDSIRTNARYKERDEKLLLEWMQAHGYA